MVKGRPWVIGAGDERDSVCLEHPCEATVKLVRGVIWDNEIIKLFTMTNKSCCPRDNSII